MPNEEVPNPSRFALAGAKLPGSEAADLKLRTILRQNQTDVDAECRLPVAAVSTNSFLILYPPVSYSVPGFLIDLSGRFQDIFHRVKEHGLARGNREASNDRSR